MSTAAANKSVSNVVYATASLITCILDMALTGAQCTPVFAVNYQGYAVQGFPGSPNPQLMLGWNMRLQ